MFLSPSSFSECTSKEGLLRKQIHIVFKKFFWLKRNNNCIEFQQRQTLLTGSSSDLKAQNAVLKIDQHVPSLVHLPVHLLLPYNPSRCVIYCSLRQEESNLFLLSFFVNALWMYYHLNNKYICSMNLSKNCSAHVLSQGLPQVEPTFLRQFWKFIEAMASWSQIQMPSP